MVGFALFGALSEITGMEVAKIKRDGLRDCRWKEKERGRKKEGKKGREGRRGRRKGRKEEDRRKKSKELRTEETEEGRRKGGKNREEWEEGVHCLTARHRATNPCCHLQWDQDNAEGGRVLPRK